MSIPASLLAISERADVRFNGDRPFDMRVHNPALYGELLRRGSLALGDGYVLGHWDCEQLDELICRLLRADANRPLSLRAQLRDWLQLLADQLRNPQAVAQAFVVGQRHYDIDPRVYAAMLDPQLTYSCGYWRSASDLNTAQEHKLRLICEKLELQPGMRLLDVGCGWGSLAAFASRHYGVEVLGITVSRRQAQWIRERLEPLPIRVALCDYRQLPDLDPGRFDRIASVGMFEHVGRQNDGAFHSTLSALLEPEGLVLLHTIGSSISCPHGDAWIERHIFPGGRLPSAAQLSRGLEGHFLIDDWESFGADYDRTLLAWCRNFEEAWPQLQLDNHPEFFRFWRYYLLSCAGFFRSRQGQLWQLVLSKPERQGAYHSWRPARPAACSAQGRCSGASTSAISHRIESHPTQAQ